MAVPRRTREPKGGKGALTGPCAFRIGYICLLICLTSGLGMMPSWAAAARMDEKQIARLCDNAAQAASRETGVPLEILLAITRTETGRVRDGATQPWPWAVNMEGRGVWFDTKAEALMYVFDFFKTGARSFDIGCFQINYRWHGARFDSIEEMFDPFENAFYAATFLSKLHQETGDWDQAVGRFHSRTAVHADRYMVRFESVVDELGQAAASGKQEDKSPQALVRQNGFSLLKPGSTSGIASLVPLQSETQTLPMIDLQKGAGG